MSNIAKIFDSVNDPDPLTRSVYCRVEAGLNELPNSRAKSLALTALEESALWAAQALFRLSEE